jgi:diguanylate cyclase (GGDEF)-like protein
LFGEETTQFLKLKERTRQECKLFKAFENRSRIFWITINLALVGLLGFIDFLTGNEFSISLFYLIPIFLSTWYMNRSMGMFISFLCVVTWGGADYFVGIDYSNPITYFWNMLIRLGFFIITTYLVSELHKTQKEVIKLARTDYVSGAINSRYFHELLKIELDRSRRYKRAFTLVYLDLDDFKQVNDRFGHDEGDKLIRFIADELKSQVRNIDIVARLGGDEFSILFPETGQTESITVMSKTHENLAKKLSQKFPFVTFSAGAVTYALTPNSTEETIKIADELMYSVKNSTKNGILYSLFDG